MQRNGGCNSIGLVNMDGRRRILIDWRGKEDNKKIGGDREQRTQDYMSSEAIKRLSIELNKESQDRKAALEESLREAVVIAGEYSAMKNTPGWHRLEREILDRVTSLNKNLHFEEGTKLYRFQGESLGLQSILNIVENAIADAEEAKKELNEMAQEEDKNG